MLVKHYKFVVKANGWCDMDTNDALLAFLISWVVEDFEIAAHHNVEKGMVDLNPQFDALLEVHKSTMQQYHNTRNAGSEFKAIKQWECNSAPRPQGF